MGNEIINEAINKIVAEREAIANQEINRLQGDLINPKFVAFENEFAQNLDNENKRHEAAITALQNSLQSRKDAFIESVKINLNTELEKKYKYDYKIAELKKLLDNEG